MGSYPKVIVQTFENYAKSQLTFIQNITDLTAKSNYVNFLYENNVVDTVLSLVININPTVRINAVLSLARLANNSELCAKQMLCSKDILKRLFGKIVTENKYYKKNCMYLIKSLCKYSSIITIVIKECGGLHALLTCMKDFDVQVREAALQAITSVTRQDASLSQFLIDSGVLPQIISCLKEEQHTLILCALSVLDEMAKQNQELAQTIVEARALPLVMNFFSHNFTGIKVQRSALVLLSNIVKHSLFLAERAIDVDLLSVILLLMAHPDESIRFNSAKIVCETVKHSVQIAQIVAYNGGIDSLINVLSSSKQYSIMPAVLALGYIAAMSPALASAVIQSQGLPHLTAVLKSDVDKYTRAGAIWTFGMIGQHSSEHSSNVSACGAVNIIMNIYINSDVECECVHKCRTALQTILSECDDYTVLESLLTPSTPVEFMTFILHKISTILPKNSKSRRSFITNGHLKMIQNLKPDIGSELFEVIKAVNCSFPEDIIQMVAGDFPETIMKKVDKYVPQNQCLFNNHQHKDEKVLNKSRSSMNKPHLSGEESLFE